MERTSLPDGYRDIIIADASSVRFCGQVLPGIDAGPQILALGARAHPLEWRALIHAYGSTPQGRHNLYRFLEYHYWHPEDWHPPEQCPVCGKSSK